MNIKSLVRDSAKVFAALQEMNDGKVVAKQDCKIYIPARFTERGLAELGATDTYIVGICSIVVDSFYAVMNVCAMVRIEPDDINRIKIQGDEYIEFTFSKGSTIITTLDLVKNDQLVYRIYDEIISKGRVPWYMSYNDLGHIFDTAKHHAGANIGENPEVTKLIVSMIARDRNDKSKYYRTVAQEPDVLKKYPPTFIALKSVIYAATNTLNKLAGSYFSTGVVSALVEPTTRSERIDTILRR
jgi:hypothetical protein